MREGLRRTGIEVVGDASWGTHFCQFYQTQQDLLDILVPYFKAGMENNEFCMWITAEPLGASEAREAMRKALPDLDRYLESGQLEILPHNEWYLKDGIFDSQRVLDGWLDKLKRAQARGFDGLRLTGNTFWLEKSDWTDFTEYEAAIDSVIGYYRMIAVCTYCVDKCSAAEVIDVIKNHQFALIKRQGRWEIVQSAEHQRAEEARAHLATIVQSSGDAIIGKSLEGTITSWNPGAEDLYGYQAEEVIGKSIALLYPPELLGELDSILERVKVGDVIRHHETVRVRKDGSRVDVSASVSSIRDRQGRVAAAAAITRDITERKQAEAELRNSEERYRTLFEHLSEGFAVHDMIYEVNGRPADYRFLEVNPAFEALTGLKHDQVVGRTVREVIPGVEQDWIDRYGEVASTGKPISFESRSEPLGKHYHVIAYSPAAGRFATLFFDVTERKRADAERERLLQEIQRRAAELDAANRELEAFSYSVSHDLRAPLRGIDGFSQALQEDCADKLDEQGREYIRVVRSESQRMAELIDALLTLSRITRTEMRRGDVDLSALAQKIAGDLLRVQPERRVEFAIAPGLVANGDPRLLQVALENLLGNAWKFTSGHPRARIEFGAAQKEGRSVYFVRDDGAGFDMAYADKLFGAFQRLHSQNRFPGTGVGLATVQRIVHRHGGRIWAEGQVEGGATFYFTL